MNREARKTLICLALLLAAVVTYLETTGGPQARRTADEGGPAAVVDLLEPLEKEKTVRLEFSRGREMFSLARRKEGDTRTRWMVVRSDGKKLPSVPADGCAVESLFRALESLQVERWFDLPAGSTPDEYGLGRGASRITAIEENEAKVCVLVGDYAADHTVKYVKRKDRPRIWVAPLSAVAPLLADVSTYEDLRPFGGLKEKQVEHVTLKRGGRVREVIRREGRWFWSDDGKQGPADEEKVRSLLRRLFELRAVERRGGGAAGDESSSRLVFELETREGRTIRLRILRRDAADASLAEGCCNSIGGGLLFKASDLMLYDAAGEALAPESLFGRALEECRRLRIVRYSRDPDQPDYALTLDPGRLSRERTDTDEEREDDGGGAQRKTAPSPRLARELVDALKRCRAHPSPPPPVKERLYDLEFVMWDRSLVFRVCGSESGKPLAVAIQSGRWCWIDDSLLRRLERLLERCGKPKTEELR